MTFSIFQNGFVDGGENESFHLDLNQVKRTKNIAGLYNFAVEKIIAKRFLYQMPFMDEKILFPDIDLEIGLKDFCEIGGFDESENLYFLEEFLHRKQNFSQLIDINPSDVEDSSFKQKVSIITNSDNWDNSKTRVNEAPELITSPPIKFNENITIGLTVGSGEHFEKLLQSFCLSFSSELYNFSFIICCFGIEKEAIGAIFRRFNFDESRFHILEENWGFEQAKLGNLGEWLVSLENCSGVSFGRCVLHRAIFVYSKHDTIWILDDDIVFSDNNRLQLHEAIKDMRRRKLQVGVGAITGDAPLPAPYIIRTQAVDFYYASYAKQKPSWKDYGIEKSNHEIHHDLSTIRTDHLEVPIGVDRAFDVPISQWSIFSGKSITRTIHNDWETFVGIPTRGGNTLLLSRNPLVNWPNVAPRCGEIQFRRGDTIWARLIERDNPELIGNIRISLSQVRDSSANYFSSIENIRGDILGSMFTRSLKDGIIKPSMILENAELREARLIMNLMRSHFILDQLNYNRTHLEKLGELISDLLKTPLPKNLYEELDSFIETFSDKINTFRLKGIKRK